jgi:hypothetical protein
MRFSKGRCAGDIHTPRLSSQDLCYFHVELGYLQVVCVCVCVRVCVYRIICTRVLHFTNYFFSIYSLVLCLLLATCRSVKETVNVYSPTKVDSIASMCTHEGKLTENLYVCVCVCVCVCVHNFFRQRAGGDRACASTHFQSTFQSTYYEASSHTKMRS